MIFELLHAYNDEERKIAYFSFGNAVFGLCLTDRDSLFTVLDDFSLYEKFPLTKTIQFAFLTKQKQTVFSQEISDFCEQHNATINLICVNSKTYNEVAVANNHSIVIDDDFVLSVFNQLTQKLENWNDVCHSYPQLYAQRLILSLSKNIHDLSISLQVSNNLIAKTTQIEPYSAQRTGTRP